MTRTSAFGLGLVTVALFAWGVLGQDDRDELCIHGHPRPRSTHVTYGGKPAVHGLIRDHVIPLGLGGPDTADNVQYQTPADAAAKDGREWRAIEAYCAGRVSLEDARKEFER
jgi:hypothetical protein